MSGNDYQVGMPGSPGARLTKAAQDSLGSVAQNFNNDLNEGIVAKFKKNVLGQKPPVKPQSAWDQVPMQAPQPDPVETLIQASMQAPQGAAAPSPAPAQPDPAALEMQAQQAMQSGQAIGPNAKLQALAAAGSPWAKAQLLKMQGQAP